MNCCRLTQIGQMRNLIVAEIECVQVLQMVQVFNVFYEILVKEPAMRSVTHTHIRLYSYNTQHLYIIIVNHQ